MVEPKKQRRRCERVKLPKGLAVAWRRGQQWEVTRMENFAIGGLFIRTPKPAPAGATVQLAFKLPDGDVRARAIVRHSNTGEGMGVEFIGMDYKTRARLQIIVRRLQAALEQLRGKK